MEQERWVVRGQWTRKVGLSVGSGPADEGHVQRYLPIHVDVSFRQPVQWMSRKLKELQAEGFLLGEPVLRGLSPYRTAHINRFGDYTLDLSKPVEPIDYKIRF